MPSVNKVIYGNQTLIDLTDATASADTILEGYTAYGANGQKITGTVTAGGAVIIRDEQDVGGGTIRYITASSAYYLQDSKEVTPTKSVQNVTPDTGYDAFETVKVNPIPNEYIVPSGTSNITENGTYGISTYASVAVNVQPDLSSLTVTPTESAQAFPPSGFLYDGYLTVNVGAISSTYVGTGVVTRSSSDLTFNSSFALFTAPSGYYSNYAQLQLTRMSTANLTFTTSTGVFKAPSGYYSTTATFTLTPQTSSNITINGSAVTTKSGYYSSAITVNVASTPLAQPAITINNTTGVITATTNQGTGYVTGGTSTSTYNLTTVAAQTITPTTASQLAVASGRFTTGSVYVGEIPSTYVQPTGTLSIASNGAFDVASYASVNVEVSGGDELEILITRRISGVYSNSTITNIGNYAFAYCIYLAGIDLSNASNISANAFYFCTGLTYVNLPVASCIEPNAFTYCSSLTSINIPMVLSIGTSAFSGCRNLSTISLPVASYIGSSAFRSCFNLLSLVLLGGSVVSLANLNAFGSTPISTYTTSTGGVYGSIFVRASLYDSYLTATNWSQYSSRFVSLTDAQIEALGF